MPSRVPAVDIVSNLPQVSILRPQVSYDYLSVAWDISKIPEIYLGYSKPLDDTESRYLASLPIVIHADGPWSADNGTCKKQQIARDRAALRQTSSD